MVDGRWQWKVDQVHSVLFEARFVCVAGTLIAKTFSKVFHKFLALNRKYITQTKVK